MKSKLPLIGLLLAALGFSVWWYSPTQVVKRRTDRLLEVMSFEEGQGRVARQAGAYALNSLLAAEVELAADFPAEANGMFERERLESAYSWLAGRVVRSRFERIAFEKVEVREPVAEVELRAQVLVQLPDARLLDGRFRIFLLWQNEGDGWRVAHVRLAR